MFIFIFTAFHNLCHNNVQEISIRHIISLTCPWLPVANNIYIQFQCIIIRIIYIYSFSLYVYVSFCRPRYRYTPRDTQLIVVMTYRELNFSVPSLQCIAGFGKLNKGGPQSELMACYTSETARRRSWSTPVVR